MEVVNFASLPLTVLLTLVAGPVLLRRAGYPWGKTVFGTLTVLFVLMAGWGVISAVQHRAGADALPAGWLVPLAAAGALWRFRGRLS